MNPNDVAPMVGFLVTAFVVSIPVIAFSARFAIKPIADALVRIRDAQGGARSADDALLMHDRRLSLMEAELQQISTTLERLAEADHFRTQLESGRPGAALPRGSTLPE
jgi:hypothetical protein